RDTCTNVAGLVAKRTPTSPACQDRTIRVIHTPRIRARSAASTHVGTVYSPRRFRSTSWTTRSRRSCQDDGVGQGVRGGGSVGGSSRGTCCSLMTDRRLPPVTGGGTRCAYGCAYGPSFGRAALLRFAYGRRPYRDGRVTTGALRPVPPAAPVRAASFRSRLVQSRSVRSDSSW